VDPVPYLLLLRKSGNARNGTQTSGYVAMNSDHYTTEAVYSGHIIIIIQKPQEFNNSNYSNITDKKYYAQIFRIFYLISITKHKGRFTLKY
jgi:hypothetical protein